ncbi:hypothetical protein [Salinispora arenicola]|uniref:hypothetical protein n=1 Tax=Salinispora arenicola TaxID=168697 RepID=UPI0003802348|nr:hypothetical protein [Salinispora arenicola]
MADRSDAGRVTASPGMCIEPVPGAAEDLVAFGRQYWDLSGVDRETGEVCWRLSLPDLYLEHGMPYQRCHVLAAAGVRAHLPEASCGNCGELLILQSRDDLQAYVDGEIVEDCCRCDPELIKAVARERTPRAAERRAADRARSARNAAIQEAQMAWTHAQRAHVAAEYPLVTDGTTLPRDEVPLSTALTVITMLRYEPEAELVAPIAEWRLPLAPTPDAAEQLLADVRASKLLRVHPDSSIDVCRWQESFTTAVAEHTDPDSVGEPQCTGTNLAWATWYVPGHDPARAAPGLEAALSRRLGEGVGAAGPDRDALLDLTVTLIAGETVRAFNHGLRQAGLPELPARHRTTLQSAARALAENLDLLACLAHASAAIERGTAIPYRSRWRHNVSVYALNRLVAARQHLDAQRKRKWSLDAPAERKQLCALTWQLFHVVLGLQPLEVSLDRVSDTIPITRDHVQPAIAGLATRTDAAAADLDGGQDDPEHPAPSEPVADTQVLTLQALHLGWSTEEQLRRRQHEWDEILGEDTRARLEGIEIGEALTLMAGVTHADDLDKQESLATYAVRWLMHHPSEDAIVILAGFAEEYGPFNGVTQMVEAMIRMCADEVIGRVGFLDLPRFSDHWAERAPRRAVAGDRT